MSEMGDVEGQRLYTRRELGDRLLRGAAATGVLAALGVTGWREVAEHRERQRDEEKLWGEAQRQTTEVEQGTASNWLVARVWPGLAILPEGTRLFGTPSMHHKSEIDWPAPTGLQLVIQRPFMVRPSLEMRHPDEELAPRIPTETLGFWLPDSSRPAFVDRSANRTIPIPTRLGKVYHSPDTSGYQPMYGVQVELEEARDIDEPTPLRYLVSERIRSFDDQGNPEVLSVVNKVVGRSVWSTNREVGNAIRVFSLINAGDIIHFPEGQ